MRNSTALLMALAVISAACVQPLSGFAFSRSSSCAAGNETIEIARNGTEVLVSGTILTPTPCYDITASGEMQGNEAVIKIKTSSRGGICIQCIGGHEFESSFLLDKGTYTVKVFIDERLAKQQEIITG